MATKTKLDADAQMAEKLEAGKNGAETSEGGSTEDSQGAETRDYVSEIGANFNLHNATAIFGKASAIKALQAYAQHGGHGVLEESDYTSSMFGGLGAIAETDTNRREAINRALNNLK